MNFYTKLFSFVSTGLLLVLILASPASAHDPLILLPEQKTPLNGPFLPDGTISFALYGSLLEKNDTRAFQFYLDSDDRLDISLLIPNLEPENQMPLKFKKEHLKLQEALILPPGKFLYLLSQA